MSKHDMAVHISVTWRIRLNSPYSAALQKQLNLPRCHFGCGLQWAQESISMYYVGCTLAQPGESLSYILNAVRCPYIRTYVRSSVTQGVASSVAN